MGWPKTLVLFAASALMATSEKPAPVTSQFFAAVYPDCSYKMWSSEVMSLDGCVAISRLIEGKTSAYFQPAGKYVSKSEEGGSKNNPALIALEPPMVQPINALTSLGPQVKLVEPEKMVS